MPALKNPRHEALAQARGMSASAAEERINRDEMGKFDRHGKTLAKNQKKSGLINKQKKTN